MVAALQSIVSEKEEKGKNLSVAQETSSVSWAFSSFLSIVAKRVVEEVFGCDGHGEC